MCQNHGENGETCGDSPETTELLVVCGMCSAEISSDNSRQDPNGATICDDCESEHCAFCEHCEETVWAEDTQSVSAHGRNRGIVDQTWCDSCASNDASECASCICRFHDELLGTYFVDSDDQYCESCRDNIDNCYQCEDCRDAFQSSSNLYSRNNRLYCENCVNDHEEEEEDCDSECTCYSGRTFHHCNVNSFTKTMGLTQCFGVELETSVCERFNNDNLEYFHCKHDGSIDGREYVSAGKMCGDDGINAIESFLIKADRAGFKVNKKCGYHLHLDSENFSGDELSRIIHAYLNHAQEWRSLVSESRRENSFCKAINPPIDLTYIMENGAIVKDKQHLAGQSGYLDRYKWLNIAAMRSHGTIEIRLHSGTLDRDKVVNWIKAHLAFWEYYRREEVDNFRSLFSVFDAVDSSHELSKFYKMRQRKFA